MGIEGGASPQRKHFGRFKHGGRPVARRRGRPEAVGFLVSGNVRRRLRKFVTREDALFGRLLRDDGQIDRRQLNQVPTWARVSRLIDVLPELRLGPGTHLRRLLGFDVYAALDGFAEGPNRHRAMMAGCTLMVGPPLRRVVREECQPPLDGLLKRSRGCRGLALSGSRPRRTMHAATAKTIMTSHS